MSAEPEIIVLCGGLSSESEVSLRSGKAVAEVLPGSRLVELTADALPECCLLYTSPSPRD